MSKEAKEYYLSNYRSNYNVMFTENRTKLQFSFQDMTKFAQAYFDSKKHLFFFECWNSKGRVFVKKIEALNEENACIIFEKKYPGLGYEKPY